METNSQLYLLIGTLGGTIIGSITTILITLINKRSEEKKHLHQLALGTAVDSWSKCIDHANLQGRGVVDSLDTFIVHLVALSDSLYKRKFNPKNIATILEEVSKITDETRKSNKPS